MHAPPEAYFNEGDGHQQQIRGEGKVETVLDLSSQSKERQQVADDLVREGVVGPVLEHAGVLQHHDQRVARDLAASHGRVEGADDALQRPSNRNLCEINILRRVRCVDLHAIDATPARWRGDAGSSPLDGAPDTLADFHTDRNGHELARVVQARADPLVVVLGQSFFEERLHGASHGRSQDVADGTTDHNSLGELDLEGSQDS